jgi:hypothetical protein
MSAVRLSAAIHWRIEPPFAPAAPSDSARLGVLAECIGAQMRQIAPLIAGRDADLMLCSTYLSRYVTEKPGRCEEFLDEIAAATGRRPLDFLHIYECAGWGFALRFLAEHTDSRLAVLVIADIDVHDLTVFRDHPLIGRSGFCVTTLLLELPGDGQPTAFVDGPYPGSGFKEFLHAIRSLQAKSGRRPTFLPFLREDLGAMAERLVGREVLGPNRFAEYGHCFGADPWIGVIEWMQREKPDGVRTVTAGALAYNGYFSLCAIDVSSATVVEFRTLDGDDAALDRIIAAAA